MDFLVLILASAVAVTPFYMVRLMVLGVPFYLPEWFISLALVWWLWLVVTRQTRLFWPKKQLLLPICLFILGALLTSWRGGSETYGALKSWVLLPALFGWLTYQTLQAQSNANKYFKWALFISGILVSLWGLFNVVADGGRLHSFFNSPNAAAMWLVPIFFILLPERRNKIILAGLALIFLAIWQTYSFGGIMGLVAGVIAVLLASNVHSQLGQRIVLTVSMLATLGFSYLSLTTALSTVLDDLFGARLGGRLQIWEIARFAVKDNLVFGIGPNRFGPYYFGRIGSWFANPIEWNVPEPHNLYLATWLSSGIFGFIGFIWLVLVTFYEQIKTKQVALFGGLVAILVHGLVDTPYWKNDLSIIFFLIIALSFASSSVSEKATT